MSDNLHLRSALAYVETFGWPVFPLKPRGKTPLTANGFKDATTDEGQIRQWWEHHPDANIGVATGAVSGFDVLDIDEGGDETLADLEQEHGKLPETVEAITGKGGRHILFQHHEGMRNSARSLPGIDVRGDGGYIVVARSVHPNGRTYEWEVSSRPGEVEIAEWPEWLVEKLQATPGNGKPSEPVPPVEEQITEGQRNHELTRLAGKMRKSGLSEQEIAGGLVVANQQRCKPPLPEEEVRRIAGSIGRYPVEEPLALVKSQEGQSGDGDWPEPQQLPGGVPPVEPFEMELLPEAFRPWIEDVSERMQCPSDYPAVGAMIVLSAVVGRQLAIRPKAADDWSIVPNLWGAVVGRPGLLKTPALQEIRRPLDRLEAQARERFEDEQREHEAQQVIIEAQQKQAREDIRKAIREKRDASQLARNAINTEEATPTRERYLVHDTSVEKLGEILGDNPRGVLVFRDELNGFLRTMDRDGHEADRAFYLEAWNGAGRFSYDRIGRGTIDIDAACVSILGGIQPGPLSIYIARSARGGGDDDGLVQRFQLVVWPDTPDTWKDVDRPPQIDARRRAGDVFTRLDQIDLQGIGAQSPEEEGATPFLRFSPAAQELFVEWRTALEHRLRSGELHPVLEGHLAKYRSLIPTLALLIHLADNGTGPVDKSALLRACAWGGYLESHARRIYAPAVSSSAVAARELGKHIEKGDLGVEFALRDAQKKGWSGLGERDELVAALDLLEDNDWLRSVRTPTAGRPRTRYQVNPEIYSEISTPEAPAKPAKGEDE